MYPQEHFAYHKKPFWPVLCLKRIGLPCCTFVTTIVTCLLQIILLSNYYVTYNFSTCRYYLVENHLSFPSTPRWVQHSYLLKRATIDPLYLWVINLPPAEALRLQIEARVPVEELPRVLRPPQPGPLRLGACPGAPTSGELRVLPPLSSSNAADVVAKAVFPSPSVVAHLPSSDDILPGVQL